MAVAPDELHEWPPPTPAPAELALAERASQLIQKYSHCFWFRYSNACIRHVEDARLIVEHLRENGDHGAWMDAQDLHKCLSRFYKKRP